MESSTSLPKKLCIYCVSKLLDIVPFIELCRDSDRKWRSVVELLHLPSTVKQNVHVILSNDCENRELVHCTKNEIQDTKEALRVLKQRLTRIDYYHRRVEREKKTASKMELSCPECELRFLSVFKLNKHIKYSNKKMCPFCYEILDLQAFKDHAAKHKLNLYFCDFCHESFVKKKNFLMHKLKHSRGNHVCLECKLSFSNLNKLTLHLSRHKRCICLTCNKKFSNKNCFLNHAKGCAQYRHPKKFICDYCLKEYSSKTSLKLHIKMHVKGYRYQCEKCGKTFTIRAHLEEHGNTHEKVFNRYTCSKCELNYSTRRGYQRHLKIHHTKEEDNKQSKVNSEFRCKRCKKSFSNWKKLKRHIRSNHRGSNLNLEEEPDMEIEVITIRSEVAPKMH